MKMVIQDQHSHIAASAVADFRNSMNLPDHCFAQIWVEVIELSGIRPRREIWISSVGNDFRMAGGVLGNEEIAGIGSVLRERTPDVVLRMLLDPVMVRSSVIRDHVE